MNKWVRRSLEIANSPGYLDRLSAIYPAIRPPRRPLPNSAKQKIAELHRAGDGRGLVTLLLALRGKGHPFPFEHPYASLLGKYPELLDKNPDIVRHLGESLLALSVKEIIRGCERPADINRVMGPAFRNWLRHFFPTQGYPVLPEAQFETYGGPAFLDAANSAVLHHASYKLGFPLERGRDFLARVGTRYVIGEARFLSTSGGSQTRDLRETIGFVKSAKKHLVAIAVLDGVIWFNRAYVQIVSELGKDEPALTALLLYDFLESLR